MARIGILLLVVALLAGTTAAFAVTQALKDERWPVAAPRFDRVFAPTCACPTAAADLTVRLRRADRITAQIVDEDGELVRTLAENRRSPRGDVTFTWDGRTDGGAIAAEGKYRLRLQLRRQERTITVPLAVRVDTTSPRVTLVAAPPPEISPDGDGVRDRVRVVYRSDEPGRAVLSVRGQGLAETSVVRGRTKPEGRASVRWDGRVRGRLLPDGEYVLVLRVHDPAGNVSVPLEVPVRIARGTGG